MGFAVTTDAEVDPVILDLFARRDMPALVRERAGVYAFFAEQAYPRLTGLLPDLEAMYCEENGRPAENPVRLLGVLILQFLTRLPDRQAADACQFDLRWKLALRMRLDEAAFHPSLLTRFRDRLEKHGLQRLAFDCVLDLLVEGGWVARASRQRIDSTHVHGVVREMGRLECVRESLRLALEAAAAAGACMAPVFYLWQRYVDEKYDWRQNQEAMCRDLTATGRAVQEFLDWCHLQPETVRTLPSMIVLRRVFVENFDPVEAAIVPLKNRVSGAVQNPHDPEAQWSTKDTIKDKAWVGFKVQVAETVPDEPRQVKGDPTTSFITSMTTQPAIGSDKPGMDQALAEQRDQGLEPPPVIYGDGAYISGHDLAQAAAENRELRGPAPSPPKNGNLFTSTVFNVNLAELQAVCPAGHTSTNCSRLHAATTGITNYRIEWNSATCGGCPVRSLCIASEIRHRTLLVGEHHAHLQQRRQEMKTGEYMRDMKKRNAIEGTHSELSRAHGLKRSRYRGLAKQRLQNWIIGAACNLKRLHRLISWRKNQQKP
jgi:transposase